MDLNDDYRKAKNKALQYLGRKDRSVFEIKTFLRKQKFSEDIIAQVTDDFQEQGFLNDRQFAYNFYQAKAASGSWGINKIKGKLIAKGISRPLVEEIERSCSDEEQYANAQKLVIKRYGEELTSNQWAPIARFLKNRGFPEQVIKKVIYDLDKT